MKTYSFEDGKYQFTRDDNGGLISAMRHGEHWNLVFKQVRFAKYFHAMLNRIDELEAAPVAPDVQPVPYGKVTTHSVTGQHFFYRHPQRPYLDTAKECVTVYAAPVAPVAGQSVAVQGEDGTPGPWFVRKRNVDGEIVDCFVSAPDCQGLPYDAEILGDDEYREGIARKLADCELIVSSVNAARAALATYAAPPVQGIRIELERHPKTGEWLRKPAPHVAEDVGVRTGWPAGMLQDDDRKLSKALANTPGAMRHVDEAVAAITAPPVAGWKLVPVEPTEEMVDAACDLDEIARCQDYAEKRFGRRFTYNGGVFIVQYMAAIDAAPPVDTKPLPAAASEPRQPLTDAAVEDLFGKWSCKPADAAWHVQTPLEQAKHTFVDACRAAEAAHGIITPTKDKT